MEIGACMAYLGKVELFCHLGAVVEMHVPYSSTQIRKDFGTTLAPDGKFPLVNAEKYSVRFSSHISKGSNFTLCGRPIIIHYAFLVRNNLSLPEDMHFVFVPRFEFHVWACGTFVIVVRPHFPHVFVKEGIVVVFVAAANANELLLAPGSLPMFLVTTLLEVN